jgi:hypothetical protein
MNTTELKRIKLAKSQKTRELLEEMNKKLDEMGSTLDLLYTTLEEQRRAADIKDIRRK